MHPRTTPCPLNTKATLATAKKLLAKGMYIAEIAEMPELSEPELYTLHPL